MLWCISPVLYSNMMGGIFVGAFLLLSFISVVKGKVNLDTFVSEILEYERFCKRHMLQIGTHMSILSLQNRKDRHF